MSKRSTEDVRRTPLHLEDRHFGFRENQGRYHPSGQFVAHPRGVTCYAMSNGDSVTEVRSEGRDQEPVLVIRERICLPRPGLRRTGVA